jgi:inhibitor of KinA sporulation pathway (predicted exonuclease)
MNSHTHYLVIDLEATCSEDGSIPREETEIIEIGAVLVEAESFTTVGEMQSFVRPIRHPKLLPFCTELTTIKQADVDGAPRFPAAMVKLREFVGKNSALFCSWGNYDRNQFERDARRHGVRVPLGRDHLNLKAAFARRFTEGRECGVGQALRRLGLSFQGTHHRGIDDARNIARMLPHVLGVERASGGRRA